MERSRDYEDLAVALAEAAPDPRADSRRSSTSASRAGFPRRSRFGELSSRGPRVPRLRATSPQRLLFASGAAALAAIAIATVVVAGNDSAPGPVALDSGRRLKPLHNARPVEARSAGHDAGDHRPASRSTATASEQCRTFRRKLPALKYSTSLPSPSKSSHTPPSRATHRDIERSAEIGLLADPADVADDSAKVFSAVHDAAASSCTPRRTAGQERRRPVSIC